MTVTQRIKAGVEQVEVTVKGRIRRRMERMKDNKAGRVYRFKRGRRLAGRLGLGQQGKCRSKRE